MRETYRILSDALGYREIPEARSSPLLGFSSLLGGRQKHLSRPILFPMTDTARDLNNTSPIDVEGLDDLYDKGLASLEQAQPAGSAVGNQTQSDGLATFCTIDEAAEKLGISKNAVQKRITRGKLNAKKVPGKYGEVWMVDLSNVPEVLHVTLEDESKQEPFSTPDSSPLEHDQGLANSDQAQPGGSAQDEKAEPSGSASQSQPSIDLAWQMELLNRVERLSQENGELRALLGEREKEIKLLTDSQHKSAAWRRFCSWFFGQ